MTDDIVKGIVKSRKSKKASKIIKTQLEECVESHAPSDGCGEWDQIEFYCVKCKTKNNCKSGSIELEKDKRGSNRLKGMCKVCETKLYRYYKVSE